MDKDWYDSPAAKYPPGYELPWRRFCFWASVYEPIEPGRYDPPPDPVELGNESKLMAMYCALRDVSEKPSVFNWFLSYEGWIPMAYILDVPAEVSYETLREKLDAAGAPQAGYDDIQLGREDSWGLGTHRELGPPRQAGVPFVRWEDLEHMTTTRVRLPRWLYNQLRGCARREKQALPDFLGECLVESFPIVEDES